MFQVHDSKGYISVYITGANYSVNTIFSHIRV